MPTTINIHWPRRIAHEEPLEKTGKEQVLQPGRRTRWSWCRYRL